MQKKDLNRILKYKNPEVVARFSKSLGISKKASEVVFEDMLRFLWLTKRVEVQREKNSRKPLPDVSILEPMLIIDEMWHTFVLYTKEYMAFSEYYFGHFMHHEPTPVLRPEITQMHDDHEAPISYHSTGEELEQLIEYVWDELGEDVALRWFKTFPKKYPKKEIRKRQLKHADAA